MHPLTTFPILLAFGLIGPLLLRLSVAVFLCSIGWDRYHKSYRFLFIGFAVAGVLLALGLYTQLASILAIILMLIDSILDRKESTSKEKRMLYSLMTAVLISLIFTGPGFYALDLPL